MCIPLLALIFCSAFALCLIVFCRQIVHIYTVCIYAGCCRCHFNYLSAFLWTYFRFSCLHRPLITYNLLLASCLVMFQIFLVFFLTRFVIVFFALQIILLHQFELARFRFLRRLCLIFFHPNYLYPSISHRTPLPSPPFIQMIVPDHRDHPCRLTDFSDVVHPLQNRSPSPNYLPFSLVFAPARDHWPYCTHRNQSAPMCVHTYHFLPNSPKHDVREISPAIGPKSGPARPKSAPPLFVFVSPVPPTPQRTHTHPYTPIHTYFHPYTT